MPTSAWLRLLRARVRWEARRDRPAARAEAEGALVSLRARPQADPALSAALAAWLTKPPK